MRRETGKEYMVKVHFGEGLATDTGPEPCVGVREDVGDQPHHLVALLLEAACRHFLELTL